MHTIRMTAALWVASLALLGGCATPPYSPAKGEKTAPVALAGTGTLTLCRGAERFQLWAKKGVVQVPVGAPVQIASRMEVGGGNVNWICTSAVEFTPEPDIAYVFNDGLVSGNRCFVELVRQDAAASNGVVIEPTAKRGTCR